MKKQQRAGKSDFCPFFLFKYNSTGFSRWIKGRKRAALAA